MESLKFANDQEFDSWDAYVLNHPHGTIFHTTSWLKNFGGKLRVAIEMGKGRIRGGVAFVETKKFGQKGIHNLPYTPFSGPLFGDLNSQKHMQSVTKYYQFITDLMNLISYKHTDFILPDTITNILPYKWAGFSEEIRVTYKCRFPTPEDFLNSINSNKRREIEKFEEKHKSGDLVIDESPELNEILKLQAETSSRKGFDAHSHQLEAVLGSIDRQFRIGLRSSNEGLFSCGVFPYDHRQVYNLINASKRIEHPVYKNANVYLLYLAIKRTIEQGKCFDFEGSTIPGVEQFYRHLAGEQYQRIRVQKSRSLYYYLLRSAKQWQRERV